MFYDHNVQEETEPFCKRSIKVYTKNTSSLYKDHKKLKAYNALTAES